MTGATSGAGSTYPSRTGSAYPSRIPVFINGC